MTGAYLRVERDGEWKNIEIEYLNRDEITEIFMKKDKEETINWLAWLAAELRLVAEYADKLREEDDDVPN